MPHVLTCHVMYSSGITSAVSDYQEKLLALGPLKQLGGAAGIKANVLVPTASLRDGVLVEQKFVGVIMPDGTAADAPVASQVRRNHPPTPLRHWAHDLRPLRHSTHDERVTRIAWCHAAGAAAEQACQEHARTRRRECL
jgi:hypothetical protein